MSDVIRLQGATFPEISRPGVMAELMMAAHYIQKGVMEQLTESGGYKALSIAYADYIPRLATREYAPGELAEELGISKQLCSKAIRELEDLKLIKRRPNPADSRSSLLSLSEQGRQLVHDGGQAADATLRQLEQSIGAEPLAQLTDVLEKLCRTLGLQSTFADLPAQSRRLNILVPLLAAHARNQLSEAVWAKGFDRIGASAGHVFGLINGEASQIRTIASILGISKQAVALAAAELDRLGYILRASDPADARQLFLRLTPRGEQLIAAGTQAVIAIEDRFRAILTPDEYRLFEESLAAWYEGVAELYDPARVLRSRIKTLSAQLLAELGPMGARALAQQLLTLTRGKL